MGAVAVMGGVFMGAGFVSMIKSGARLRKDSYPLQSHKTKPIEVREKKVGVPLSFALCPSSPCFGSSPSSIESDASFSFEHE